MEVTGNGGSGTFIIDEDNPSRCGCGVGHDAGDVATQIEQRVAGIHADP